MNGSSDKTVRLEGGAGRSILRKNDIKDVKKLGRISKDLLKKSDEANY